jgi:ATP-dependent DNA helicase RecG
MLRESGLGAANTLQRAGRRLGFLTVRELLFHLPRRYDDLREMRQLGELVWVEEGTVVSARVRVGDVRVEPSFRRRIQRTIARLEDETGSIDATWFGRRFIERRLFPGAEIIVSGKLKRFGRKLTIDNPDFQPVGRDDELLHVGRIVPVYRLTAGLTAARLRIAMREALDRAGKFYEEYLPPAIRDEEHLAAIAPALEEAHYPASFEGRDGALRRLAFDELLALQLGMVGRRRQRGRDAAEAIRTDDEEDARLRAALRASLRRKLDDEVELTVDQDTAIAAIRDDLARETPMLRLLQGDVGSGKTLVATMALLMAVEAGAQGAFLAPTEILARQHYDTLQRMLAGLPVNVAVLTGRDKGRVRESTLMGLADGSIHILVGTHAIFQEAVAYRDLGLVVVDEQHRFGVAQRLLLQEKGAAPHLLAMTATPIPRTLTLAQYGEMDVSRLDEMPPGRQPIETRVMSEDRLGEIVEALGRHLDSGGQAYWVCPLVEESEKSDLAAAEARAGSLQARFGDRVGLIHGRMKPAEKDAVMARFASGDLGVLVATTVIEVGVDVPNATLIVIEHADRFGLAQLHQLRGRVGRGTGRSICLLIRGNGLSETSRARLALMRETNDGFRIAEEDLRLRGAGEMLGTRQSGEQGYRLATPEHFASLQQTAHDDARLMIDRDGGLSGSRGQAARTALYLFERDAGVQLLRSG